MYKSDYGDPYVTFRLPEWQISALDNLAANQGTTRSAIIRELVYDLLDKEGCKPPANQPRRRAREGA